jgi:hypothetical protein
MDPTDLSSGKVGIGADPPSGRASRFNEGWASVYGATVTLTGAVEYDETARFNLVRRRLVGREIS